MRICPACGSQYPDDANFCPMDAVRLPDAILTGAATMVDAPGPIAGQFLPDGPSTETSLGYVRRAVDLKNKAAVSLLEAHPRTVAMAGVPERAVRELKQISKITSEKLVRVIDAVLTDDGRVLVATEPTTDATLEALVRDRGPLSLARAKEVVLAVGEALAEAQKVGVIHRDLSPEHVLVGDKVRLGGTFFV